MLRFLDFQLEDAIANAGGAKIKYTDMDGSKLAYGEGISRSTYPNLITCVCMQFNNQYAYRPYFYNEKMDSGRLCSRSNL